MEVQVYIQRHQGTKLACINVGKFSHDTTSFTLNRGKKVHAMLELAKLKHIFRC